MAYYAEIEDGKVKQVLVLNDAWTNQQSLDWLNTNISTNEWIETNTDGSIRNKYAGIGDEYHADIDKFVSKVPFDSWTLDKDLGMYIPPLPKPIAIIVGYVWKWSVELKKWISDKVGNK